MRDIEFKAKTVESKEWVSGNLVKTLDDSWFITCASMDCKYTGGFISPMPNKVIPETVCEYTGLSDMHKSKIFEGDRLCESSIDKYYTVIFEDGCFYALLDDNVLILLSEINDVVEVVGNIHNDSEKLYSEICCPPQLFNNLKAEEYKCKNCGSEDCYIFKGEIHCENCKHTERYNPLNL